MVLIKFDNSIDHVVGDCAFDDYFGYINSFGELEIDSIRNYLGFRVVVRGDVNAS